MGVDFDRARDFIWQRRNFRLQRRAGFGDEVGLRARQPLDDDVDAAARRLGHLADGADGADRAQIGGVRLVLVVGLQRQEQQSIAGERAVHRLDGHEAIDRERLDRQRKHDVLPQGKDR